MIPTRIVAKPQKVLTTDAYGHRLQMLRVSCNDGQTYTLSSLATAVGISKKELQYRITSRGWNHPDILAPGRLGAAPARCSPGAKRRHRRRIDPDQPAPTAATAVVPPVAVTAGRPTRIIAPPFRGRKTDRLGRQKVVDVMTCDNGQDYTTSELAKIAGVSQEAFRARMTTSGWDHPDILRGPVPKGLCLDGVKRNSLSEGSDEWRMPSDRCLACCSISALSVPTWEISPRTGRLRSGPRGDGGCSPPVSYTHLTLPTKRIV
jgi:hypothetical protein